jgi:hypothetical protein
MALTDTERLRVEAIERKLNELQTASNNLATRKELKNLLALLTGDVQQLRIDVDQIELTGSGSALANHKLDPAAHPEINDRFYLRTDFVGTSAGLADAGKPVKLNASGLVDSSMIGDISIPDDITLTSITQITNRSHSDLQNLTADDHTIYLNDARFALKTVTQLAASGASDYGKFVRTNPATGAIEYVTLDDSVIPDVITLTNITQITNRSHTNLQDIGTNTHAQIDTQLSDLADITDALPTTLEALTFTIDYNLAGAATVPPGTIFRTQDEIDNFLSDEGTTAFQYAMDCWDALPTVLAHDVTFNCAAGVHRPRSTDTTQSNWYFGNRISAGGKFTVAGAAVSTWTTVVGSLTLSSVVTGEQPRLIFNGSPFAGMNLRGLPVVLSTQSTPLWIRDHDNNTLYVTTTPSPTPTGAATIYVARPSTILRNSLNDTTAFTDFYGIEFALGVAEPTPVFSGTPTAHTVQDLQIDHFGPSGSGQCLATTTPYTYLFVNRILNDYTYQYETFGRTPEGGTFFIAGNHSTWTMNGIGIRSPYPSVVGNSDVGLLASADYCKITCTNASIYGLQKAAFSVSGGYSILALVTSYMRCTCSSLTSSLNRAAIYISTSSRLRILGTTGASIITQDSATGYGIFMAPGSAMDFVIARCDFKDNAGDCIYMGPQSRIIKGDSQGANKMFGNLGGNAGYGVRMDGPGAQLYVDTLTDLEGALGAVRLSDGTVLPWATIQTTGPVVDGGRFNVVSKA